MSTQEGRPSGKDPMRARERMTAPWILAPLVILAVFAIGFGLKVLL